MPHMPPASAWEARARAARREADVFALTADLFWARQDPAGDTWSGDYRRALYAAEQNKVAAAVGYAVLCEATADSIRQAGGRMNPDCAGCGHSAWRHGDGNVCWAMRKDSETSERVGLCLCESYTVRPAAADGVA